MTSQIGRRELMASAALALLPLQAPRAAAAEIPAAPIARVAPVVDDYFGEKVTDPYRWMENSQDPDWLPFLKGQNAHTRAILDRVPGRAALLHRIGQLSGGTAVIEKLQRTGGALFYEQRPAGANNFKLFVRDAAGVRVLIDPTSMGGGQGHISLDWWQASPDGSRLVYGLSANGSEDSVLHVMKVATGEDLPERIPDTEAAFPNWLDDSSGFFYNRLTHPVGSPERFLDSQARFHRIGTDPAQDPVIMKRGLVAGIDYDPIQSPYIITFAGAKHAILMLRDVRSEFRLMLAPIADILGGKPHWVSVAGFDDEITDCVIDGAFLYLLANKGAPRGRIVRTPVAGPSLASASEMVPQGADVIEAIEAARDGFYLRIMDGGISRLRRLTRDGKLRDITTPFDCTIGQVATNPAEDGALVPLGGWLTTQDVWHAGADGTMTATGLNPASGIDVSAHETTRGFATARDGTKIPYSLIHRKGLRLDGTSPAWIQAYGSYGLSAYTPEFAGPLLALVDAGFIVGFANVRGGGEYGRAWHKAGQLQNKPNTWRDLIDVCEALCQVKYTAPQRLTIGGRSAGGITMGRAMTERPDLFAAVIDGVGWSNPLRYVTEQNGFGEEPEWGAIREKSGYLALKQIDSYQAVRDGVKYPAVLLTTGVTDPRVAPFHVAKMTARLQAASRSGKPILLRVDFDAGHGIGSTPAQHDAEAADTFAFLLWQTGVAGYQPA